MSSTTGPNNRRRSSSMYVAPGRTSPADSGRGNSTSPTTEGIQVSGSLPAFPNGRFSEVVSAGGGPPDPARPLTKRMRQPFSIPARDDFERAKNQFKRFCFSSVGWYRGEELATLENLQEMFRGFKNANIAKVEYDSDELRGFAENKLSPRIGGLFNAAVGLMVGQPIGQASKINVEDFLGAMTEVVNLAKSRDLTPLKESGGDDLDLSDKIAFLMRMEESGARAVRTPRLTSGLSSEIASGLADKFMELQNLERVHKAITADNSFVELIPRNIAFADLLRNITVISLHDDIYSQMAEGMKDFKLFSLPQGAELSFAFASDNLSGLSESVEGSVADYQSVELLAIKIARNLLDKSEVGITQDGELDLVGNREPGEVIAVVDKALELSIELIKGLDPESAQVNKQVVAKAVKGANIAQETVSQIKDADPMDQSQTAKNIADYFVDLDQQPRRRSSGFSLPSSPGRPSNKGLKEASKKAIRRSSSRASIAEGVADHTPERAVSADPAMGGGAAGGARGPIAARRRLTMPSRMPSFSEGDNSAPPVADPVDSGAENVYDFAGAVDARAQSQAVAATTSDDGTYVDFGKHTPGDAPPPLHIPDSVMASASGGGAAAASDQVVDQDVATYDLASNVAVVGADATYDGARGGAATAAASNGQDSAEPSQVVQSARAQNTAASQRGRPPAPPPR